MVMPSASARTVEELVGARPHEIGREALAPSMGERVCDEAGETDVRTPIGWQRIAQRDRAREQRRV